MKKTISLIALFAISTSASAFDYKFNLEGRADFVHSDIKTEAASVSDTHVRYVGFQSSLIRLNMMGNINDSLSYRMRYRFNQAPTATTRDNSTNSLDYLYVDHKNSIFTTRFGKMNWAEAYGRESFTSSTDLFLASDAYTAYNSGIGSYRYGVSATFTILETQKFTLAVSNPSVNLNDTGTESTNNTLAYAAHYSSIMFDKKFQPMLSYTIATQNGDPGAGSNKGDNTMMVAGFRTETMGLVLDLDWKKFKAEKRTAATADSKTTSVFANVAYSITNLGLSPFVQYVHDDFSDLLVSNAAEYKKNSFAGGVMWKPFNDTNFRYHLVYTNINRKNDSAAATSKVKEDRITFGIKADI